MGGIEAKSIYKEENEGVSTKNSSKLPLKEIEDNFFSKINNEKLWNYKNGFRQMENRITPPLPAIPGHATFRTYC